MFPKIRSTILGVPIIRTIVYWGLYWGPFILGNYHLYLYMHAELLTLDPKLQVGQGIGLLGLNYEARHSCSPFLGPV